MDIKRNEKLRSCLLFLISISCDYRRGGSILFISLIYRQILHVYESAAASHWNTCSKCSGKFIAQSRRCSIQASSHTENEKNQDVYLFIFSFDLNLSHIKYANMLLFISLDSLAMVTLQTLVHNPYGIIQSLQMKCLNIMSMLLQGIKILYNETSSSMQYKQNIQTRMH